ncbi:hypothetical protein BaRGS_00025126, partial [Batillaria attramentaria]
VTLGNGDFCTRYSSSSFFGTTTTWCEYGCCKSRCCDFTLTTWMIVAIVFGSVVFISVVGTCICCLIHSQKKRRGVVVGQAPMRSTVFNTNSAQYSNTTWGQPVPTAPPPYAAPQGYSQPYSQQYGFTYGQPAPPPPPPAYSDPAYPPGQSYASPFAAAAANKS